MSAYSGPVYAVQIPVYGGMLRMARNAAMACRDTSPLAARNSYYTPKERHTLGNLCELAFAAWKGIRHTLLTDNDRYRIGDVGGTEIKFMGWRKPGHMDQCEGGSLYVPDWQEADCIVGMTAFDDTLRRYVFVDGWIDRVSALRFPRGGSPRRSPGGRRVLSHLVPYSELRPISEMP